MKKIVTSLLLLVTLSFCLPKLYSAGPSVPVGMEAAGIKAIESSPDGKVMICDFKTKPNTKHVETKDPKITALLEDETISMKDVHQKIFETVGLIPMVLYVENNSDHSIQLKPKPLKNNITTLNENAVKLVRRYTKLRKAGTYVATVGYYSLLTASTIGLGTLPFTIYEEILPILMEVPGAIYSALSIPFVTPIIAATTGIFTLKYLSPYKLSEIASTIVGKYHNCSKYLWPSTVLKELEEMGDILKKIESNNNSLKINPNQSTTYIMFVKKEDRDKINSGSLVPELDFE